MRQQRLSRSLLLWHRPPHRRPHHSAGAGLRIRRQPTRLQHFLRHRLRPREERVWAERRPTHTANWPQRRRAALLGHSGHARRRPSSWRSHGQAAAGAPRKLRGAGLRQRHCSLRFRQAPHGSPLQLCLQPALPDCFGAPAAGHRRLQPQALLPWPLTLALQFSTQPIRRRRSQSRLLWPPLRQKRGWQPHRGCPKVRRAAACCPF